MPRPHEGLGLYGPWQTSFGKQGPCQGPMRAVACMVLGKQVFASQGPRQGPMRALAYMVLGKQVWQAKAHAKAP